ncbi:MarR family transcriptional regulator [Brevibacillus reuszeri]|uniref:MarR family winged helix-turn-helix transcriptional regulator n=1 Tax=Brevibacillus reuszeri TaxID=54915 RepID=UPI001B27127C|nr:MarR family transcriptional regulator [Brevibacillus reuszeri]GIO04535.1 MarR family transcriptional regulator [Brevibacillus reuszeri]
MKIETIKETLKMMDKINTLLAEDFQALYHFEITPKQSILLQQVQEHEKITIGELAKHLNMSLSSTSQLVAKLEQDGYVKREVNSANRRETFVKLAEKAKQMYAEIEAIDDVVIEKYFSKLEEEEMIHFQRFTNRLHDLILAEKSK